MTVLTDVERQALEFALDDEYRSYETYATVVRDFGAVRPFSNIVDAEARHVSALLTLFDTYGIIAPKSKWIGRAPRFASLDVACAAGIQGEIENVAIYDRALKTTSRADILVVYRALREASEERHLPAFRRCAQRPIARS